MEFLIGDILLAGVGWFYLLVRYRKRKVIAKVLADKYEGRYSNAGSSVSLGIFAILISGLLVAFLIGAVVWYLRGLIKV